MARSPSWQTRAYLALATISGPFWRLALKQRLKRGKEDPERLPERLAAAFASRPDGPLVWFHALSVGESLALLPLLDLILDRHPSASILLTTATRTSAEALARQNLPTRIIHQMLPIDTKRAVDAFLDHWHPDLAVFAELDFWPTLMWRTYSRGVPMALINSRMSEKSFEKRRSGAALFADVISLFRVVLLQDEGSRDRFTQLGADPGKLRVLGALKGAPRPLPAEARALTALRSAVGKRPIWLAASTEEREHAQVLEVHRKILSHHPDALLVLAPRHPREADAIIPLLASVGAWVRWSGDARPDRETSVLLADTIGEMGLWYRLAPVTFMGHSLPAPGPPMRGKNPFEAAVLDTALVHGPNVIDFAETYDRFDRAGAAIEAENAEALATGVLSLFDPKLRGAQVAAARGVISQTSRVLEDTYAALEALITDRP